LLTRQVPLIVGEIEAGSTSMVFRSELVLGDFSLRSQLTSSPELTDPLQRVGVCRFVIVVP